MTNRNELDLEKKFLEDIEKATALSLESKALEEFRRRKTQYSTDISSESRSSYKNVVKLEDYQRILKLRQQSFEQQTKEQNKNVSNIAGNITPTPLLAPPSSQKEKKNQMTIPNNPGQPAAPDLISFTSPTSNDTSHSNFVQMCEEIHRMNLRPHSFDASATTYQTQKYDTSQQQGINLNLLNQQGMQLVPYDPPYATANQQNVKNPLTPDQLNKLYNMNNVGGYGLRRSTVPIVYQTTNIPFQNMNTTYATNPPPQPLMYNPYAISSTSTPFLDNQQYSNNSLYNNPINLSNIPNIIGKSNSIPQDITSSELTINNLQKINLNSNLSRNSLNSPTTSNNNILTPSSSAYSINKAERATSSTSTVIYRRKSEVRKLGDDLIDLGTGIEDNSRVSVLEAFDPLFLADSNDDKDETSSEYYMECDPFDYLYFGGTQYSDPVYDAVNKTEKTPISPTECPPTIWHQFNSETSPPPLPPRNIEVGSISKDSSTSNLNLNIRSAKLYDNILFEKSYDAELISFYEMVKKIRMQYKYNDTETNVGHVVAAEFINSNSNDTSIKVLVHPALDNLDSESVKRSLAENHRDSSIDGSSFICGKGQFDGYGPPVLFTCDINTTVEHVIMQVVCALEGQIKGTANDFMLKPIGVMEWLRPTSKLNQLQCVHDSIKLEKDVHLGLCPKNERNLRILARTHQDDQRDAEIKIEDIISHQQISPINYESLMIILETLETEIEKLEAAAKENSPVLSSNGVTQTIKAVCSHLGYIETLEIVDAIKKLKDLCSSRDVAEGSSMDVISEQGHYAQVQLRPRTICDQVKRGCNEVRHAVQQLVDIYSKAFRVNFSVKLANFPLPVKKLETISDAIVLSISCLYRLPPQWKFDDYLLGTQIYHGTRYISEAIVSHCTVESLGNPYARLKFKSWLCFDNIPVCTLPRESRLLFVLYGCTLEANNKNSETKDNYKNESSAERMTKTELGWFSIQFFDFDSTMIQGSYLLPLWPATAGKYLGPAPSKGTHPFGHEYPVLGIEIPDYGGRIVFPEHYNTDMKPITRYDFSSLDVNLQEELMDTAEQGYHPYVPDRREVLWEKRYYLQSFPQALPKVLYASHSWDFASAFVLHSLIDSWDPLSPVQALELMLPRFPDIKVREYAVKCFSVISNDRLIDYLPQLVQALKHDTYEASPMANFLLSRSLESPRIAHFLYWLLVQSLPGDCPQNTSTTFLFNNIDHTSLAQARYHQRNQLLLRALLATCGEKLASRFLSQNIMCKNLADIAQNIKQAKDKKKILEQGLEMINSLFAQPTALPLGPELEVIGTKATTSSFFNSNTLPLKINFVGPDNVILPAIFKSGDDLQQDMLTIQLVRLMDKLWLERGLDLKMVTFNCVPTGNKRGMIELVSDAETLRKIQVEYGLTGSFKDNPIADWLARHNSDPLEYERAVDNFTLSCAGYSVATYILGICDRHNDNIMLKMSGHLFHIDFGKFLGDVQMFGNLKRDRTPFVLTSDMAFVINGGEKPTSKFQHFVDLCCQAFNIVRNHGDLLLHMLSLMATSGIPNVNADSVNYVRRALLPGESNPEAAASFAKMIHISLKNWFTQINFFMHNLAQLKFGSEEATGELLSFVPRTYTMAQEGRLKSVSVLSHQKRYNSEKFYIYILRVTRQNQPDPAYLFRTYKEFLEFHEQLCYHYPLAKLHSLPSGLQVGRSHIRTVADRRLREISKFLETLFNSADEIAHSNLVYTFFHPVLRDQQEANINVKKVKEIRPVNQINKFNGEIKFSLQYHRGALTVMIHHAKDLPVNANGQEPNTYVKCYLKPDPTKVTKRKTKVVKKSCFPVFMETLEYRMPLEVVKLRQLEVTIWSHDTLQENEFLGGVVLVLGDLNLLKELIEWYKLEYLTRSPKYN